MAELLDEILADSRVKALRDLRESHAARARDAQASHKGNSKIFIAATAMAAVAGALILYGSGREATEATDLWSDILFKAFADGWLRNGLFVIEIVALAAAAYAAEMMRETRSGIEWYAERRAAEIGRVDLFDTIMALAADKGVDAEQEAFDYFAEKQLESQMSYHQKSEAKHRTMAGRSAVIGAVVAALIAATGASGIGGPHWIAIAAFVGVIAPVFLNTLQSWRDLTLDRQHSERYRATWAELTRLSADVDNCSIGLAAGDPKPARDLVKKVHSVMRAENESWASS